MRTRSRASAIRLAPVRQVLVSRGIAAAIAIVGLFAAWSLDAGREIGYPLVQIEQGVSVIPIAGTRVFAIRDGAAVTLLGRETPGTGTQLVYCPDEAFFVSPDDYALYDRQGRYVAGPGTRDMDRYPHRVDQGTLQVFLDGEVIQRPRSVGEISGEAGEAYQTWKADPDTPRAFCQNPAG